MKHPAFPFKDKSSPDYQPSITSHSCKNTATANDEHSTQMAVKLKDHPGPVAFALAQEIRNPLGHIKLSVEMLESILEDNDLKMYLEVIMRNSIRIDNLIQEFLLESHLTDATQADNISNHRSAY